MAADVQHDRCEVGPDVDPGTVFAVYEAEVELNPDEKARVHNLAILTLR